MTAAKIKDDQIPACKSPCPKCGSQEKKIRYLYEGEAWNLVLKDGKVPRYDEDFVKVEADRNLENQATEYYFEVILEHIFHTCQSCQFKWSTQVDGH